MNKVAHSTSKSNPVQNNNSSKAIGTLRLENCNCNCIIVNTSMNNLNSAHGFNLNSVLTLQNEHSYQVCALQEEKQNSATLNERLK